MTLNRLERNFIRIFFIAGLLIFSQFSKAETQTERWRASNENNTGSIDHSTWQNNLDSYLLTDHASNVHLYDYQAVTKEDKKALETYLSQLSKIDPRVYARQEQMAYWINLYNAATVNLILDHYPVKSITKLGDSFFSFGPWDDKIITINHQPLTLNDIEHQILRPIWKDPRIHYAVNCASWSCPNLAASAYTAKNLTRLLEQGAQQYINHPRGVRREDNEWVFSKIYSWYQQDFGGNEELLIKHIQQYANPELKQQLSTINFKSVDIEYEYNWQLNAPK